MDSAVFASSYPRGKTTQPSLRWAVAAWCVMLAAVIWYALRLKTVFLTEDSLLVRSFVTEVEIPFSEIASVKHNWFWKNATLQLNSPSAFGDRILFIHRRRVVTEGGKRSTLDLLRELIRQK
jgi:hypothetical protein